MLILTWWGSIVLAVVLPYVGWAERGDNPRRTHRRRTDKVYRQQPVAPGTGGGLDPVAAT